MSNIYVKKSRKDDEMKVGGLEMDVEGLVGLVTAGVMIIYYYTSNKNKVDKIEIDTDKLKEDMKEVVKNNQGSINSFKVTVNHTLQELRTKINNDFSTHIKNEERMQDLVEEKNKLLLKTLQQDILKLYDSVLTLTNSENADKQDLNALKLKISVMEEKLISIKEEIKNIKNINSSAYILKK